MAICVSRKSSVTRKRRANSKDDSGIAHQRSCVLLVSSGGENINNPGMFIYAHYALFKSALYNLPDVIKTLCDCEIVWSDGRHMPLRNTYKVKMVGVSKALTRLIFYKQRSAQS